MKVDYLKKEQIESATLELLHAYGKRFKPVTAPVPVDEILECHLGLSLELGDLKTAIGVPDALGATWIKAKRVMIDAQLDPTENPDKEGRYRFTVAHEIGHWQLHRIYFEMEGLQSSFLSKGKPSPSIVCRSSNAEPMEIQANMFASYLLMPTHLVEATWQEERGSLTAVTVTPRVAEQASRYGSASDREALDLVRRMAARLKTSNQAMQIRLTDLRLINTAQQTPTIFDAQAGA